MTLPKAVVENRQDQKHREKERMKNGRSELWREGLREVYDIFYLPDGSLRHTLDLIRPEGQEKLPVIIEIHGGGYIACEKNINRLHARAFAQQGFAVVNGDYTLHPEADFVAELRELAAIVDWVGENAERYGLDAERVYMSGDSAGGHLVLLYAMLPVTSAVNLTTVSTELYYDRTHQNNELSLDPVTIEDGVTPYLPVTLLAEGGHQALYDDVLGRYTVGFSAKVYLNVRTKK